MRLLAGLGAGALLVPLLVGAPPAVAQTAPPASARIMLVGDSVTQGAAGDYTWRYHLWKTLQAGGKDVDFVGPRKTLADDTTDYADPGFDQDHAARWGAMLTGDGWWVVPYPEDVTADLVATYRPDVVVEALGVNNLVFGGAAPAAVIDLVRTFVADVREANPGAAVVLGQLTQHWMAGVDDFNALLADLATELDRPEARVLLATAPADYTAAGDTYDGSHPNAQGEEKIAAQFAAALSSLPLPDKVTVTPTFTGATSLSARPRKRSVRLTFTSVPGATRQAIWKRDRTRHGRWRLVAYVGPRTHYRVRDLRRHHRYAFKLRAYQQTVPSTRYSNVVRVRTR